MHFIFPLNWTVPSPQNISTSPHLSSLLLLSKKSFSIWSDSVILRPFLNISYSIELLPNSPNKRDPLLLWTPTDLGLLFCFTFTFSFPIQYTFLFYTFLCIFIFYTFIYMYKICIYFIHLHFIHVYTILYIFISLMTLKVLQLGTGSQLSRSSILTYIQI